MSSDKIFQVDLSNIDSAAASSVGEPCPACSKTDVELFDNLLNVSLEKNELTDIQKAQLRDIVYDVLSICDTQSAHSH